jgi:hypothetical protein
VCNSYLKIIHRLPILEDWLSIAGSEIEFFHDLKFFAVDIVSLRPFILSYGSRGLRIAKKVWDIFHALKFLQLLRLHINLLDFDCLWALHSPAVTRDNIASGWTASIWVGGVFGGTALWDNLIVNRLIFGGLQLHLELLLLSQLQYTLVLKWHFISLKLLKVMACLVWIWTCH